MPPRRGASTRPYGAKGAAWEGARSKKFTPASSATSSASSMARSFFASWIDPIPKPMTLARSPPRGKAR